MATNGGGRRMVRPGMTFRVFVSSTFRDFAGERNALQQRVWSCRRELYRKRGGRFEVTEMMLGEEVPCPECGETLKLNPFACDSVDKY